jgi:predicted nucleotidyltransferase
MKNISLNLRGKLEPQVLRLLRGAAQVAAEQRVPFFVVGASARDMVLEHGFGVRSKRATTDIDLAIAIGDWNAYKRFFLR